MIKSMVSPTIVFKRCRKLKKPEVITLGTSAPFISFGQRMSLREYKVQCIKVNQWKLASTRGVSI